MVHAKKNAARQLGEHAHEDPHAAERLGLLAVCLESLNEAGREATVRVGRELVVVQLDEAVSTRVLVTALARNERVLVQREPEGWVLVGALRTAATPGIDEGDEFLINARRIVIHAEHEFGVASGAASLVLRAHGLIEVLSQNITSRAASVHKIIGRMIRLN